VQRTRGLNHTCLLPNRVTSLGQWPGWARLSPNKKEWVGSGLEAQPTQSVFVKGVFGKTRPYALAIIFILILVWCLAKRAPFLYQKIPKIFGGLHWFIYGLLALFFFFVLVFFFSYVLNLWTITVECKYVVQGFFLYPILKGSIKIRDKQEKWHRKFLLQIHFLQNIFTDARVRSIAFFWICAIFTNVIVGSIRMNCSLTPESETWKEG
jgi:hypothetical protein